MPEERWSEPERWAWEQIRAARIVDFNVRDGHDLDPKVPDGWHEGRKIGTTFLSEILFHKSYSDAIPFEGVQINGAYFPDILILSYARANRPLHLRKCRFEKGADFSFLRTDDVLSLELSAFAQGTNSTSVSLQGARVEGPLAMIGATIAGTLAMHGLEVERDLFMQGLVASEQVDLLYARIRGQLTLDGARVSGALNMGGLETGHLFMRRSASFEDVDLTTARVHGHVVMDGANVTGLLNMSDLEAGHLFMREPASFKEVVLVGARVHGLLSMNGAKVTGMLNMYGLQGARLLMRDSASFKDVDLTAARIRDHLSMDGAIVTGSLNMTSLEVGHLFMRGNATFQDVDLTGTIVAGYLAMHGATVAGSLTMGGLRVQNLLMCGATVQKMDATGARVGAELSMEGAMVTDELNMSGLDVEQRLSLTGRFKDVNLIAARIGMQLDMTGASVSGLLMMNSLSVGQHLLMHGRATFKDVHLICARIAGQLAMDNATITGALEMNGLEVGQDLLMRNASFERPINFAYGRVGSSLNLSGSELSELNMSAARIEGYLRLVSDLYPAPRWAKEAQLDLRDAHAGRLADSVDDEKEAWPDKLHLNGFTYRWGEIGGGLGGNMLTRGVAWYVGWLARDPSYSPQPYHQCAKVLREMGHPEMADDVLYAGRERERREALRSGDNPRWTWLTALKLFIGYGYGTALLRRPLAWVFGLTLLGMVVLYSTGVPREPDGAYVAPWFFSLDLLLPIIQLHEPHYDVILGGCAKYYFALHKLIGYVLALFLIAGLSGLTR